jgi:ABC-type uncharacterized transport system ATPase subunit
VLRDGRNVGTVDTVGTDSRSLARMMVGREVVLRDVDDPRDATARIAVAQAGAVAALQLSGVGTSDDRGRPALHDVDLTVGAGEIVGVCGVAGNGQRELAEVVTGMRRTDAGSVVVAGTQLAGGDPRAARSAGVAHVPEDRLHTGTAPSLGIEDNLALTQYRSAPLSTGPFLQRTRIRERARALMEQFDVRAAGPAVPVRLLSGGNVQKVLLARELSSAPRLLVAASPTRGLDVGAIESVREVLLRTAADGVGILLISEDLDEVLDLSDRIAVLYEGRVVALVDRAATDATELGLLMGGSTAAAGAS